MNKNLSAIICIIGLLSGCNYLRAFPLYSNVYVEHPQKIQLFSSGLATALKAAPNTDNAKEYTQITKRISGYLEKSSGLNNDVVVALQNIEVILGMKEEQVILVVGAPTKETSLGNNDLWVYMGDRGRIGERNWYYKWGKLTFENKVLENIEVQHINIVK